MWVMIFSFCSHLAQAVTWSHRSCRGCDCSVKYQVTLTLPEGRSILIFLPRALSCWTGVPGQVEYWCVLLTFQAADNHKTCRFLHAHHTGCQWCLVDFLLLQWVSWVYIFFFLNQHLLHCVLKMMKFSIFYIVLAFCSWLTWPNV